MTKALKISSELPIGTIIMHPGTPTLQEWVLADGRALSRSTYAELFLSIGVLYGVGDGVTTFNIPDFRGIYPKGAGTTNRAQGRDAQGNFYGANLGDYMVDRFQQHGHAMSVAFSVGAGGAAGPSITNVATQPVATAQAAIAILAGPPRESNTTEPQSLAVSFFIKVSYVQDVFHG